ncbi:MAG: DoxX family protein [Bacteroidales bacterium]|nr:DoxX family protein [Bacteroidales bacterium]
MTTEREKTLRIIDCICRVFVGSVFLFSSFVKGVDPMGTAYKIEEYMTAWSVGGLSFEWAQPLAPIMSVALVTVEFLIGIMLITNSLRVLNAWLLLLVMSFFLVTTLIDAITNKVTDCGCFGDFVKLTNWQTFWKNVVLMVPTVVIFCCRNIKKKHRTYERDILIVLFAIAAMVGFAIYNINNEPVLDFRAWKVGNKMIPENNAEIVSYVTYKNKKTGEKQEFLSKKLNEYLKDSTWVQEWEWVDSRVVDPTVIAADGFSMSYIDGEDHAKEIIGSASPVMIATSYDLNGISEKGVESLQRVKDIVEQHEVNFLLLTASLPEEVEDFLDKNNLSSLEYYFADNTAIKTMLRSNPGYILLKDAEVKGKWHYRNYNRIRNVDFEQLDN